jgi:hypothetical protein
LWTDSFLTNTGVETTKKLSLLLSSSHNLPIKLDPALKLLIFTQELPGSNLGRTPTLLRSNFLPWFSSVIHCKFRGRMRPRALPSTSIPIHYSRVPFDLASDRR